ncbi:putative DNA repair protein endonuclease SAE2/CtIP C-terminus [Lyophyllum shimeji]|uniref:DNA repair protein endonuclease SAE2/CtIP C-terminus n=1 Tax=Lyophyllum shimeji TaxID=47721 RepID=A0A9P3PT45_LYOSH|nr:putative DNA repair protein endonuclease SAE2/CtIP C-terminus [Lyophyllum shimeji]
MEPSTNTFSNKFLQERDRVMLEKHQKDLEIRDRKNERLKRANDDTLKQLYDAQHRGNRLARSLGFNDIFEAQITIDTADGETSYKECLERVEALQQQLSAVQEENERFQALIDALERDRERLRAELATAEKKEEELKAHASKHHSLADKYLQDFEQLQRRYDALADVKERAAQRYKVDYAKWRRFRDWIFTEEAEHEKDKNEGSITEEEKRSRYIASIMRKKKMLMELGFQSLDGDENKTPTQISPPPPLGGIKDVECDKENISAPRTETKARRSSTPASSSSKSTLSSTAVEASNTAVPPGTSKKPQPFPAPPLRNRLINTVSSATAPSSSPTVFNVPSSTNTTRALLTFHPVIAQQTSTIKQEPGSSPSISTAHRPSKRQRPNSAANLASSDTEEESQAVGNHSTPTKPLKVEASPATSPAHMPSSQTEADSQSQFLVFPDPAPYPPRPVSTPQTLPRPHPSLPDRPAFTEPRRVVSRDAVSLQPTKIRRLSDEHARSSAMTSSTPKPKEIQPNEPSTEKGKGKVVQAPVSTPANSVRTSGQKRMEDYSAFKGRGRYAKDVKAIKDTINAQFEIDPAKNGGLDFQYDEVVRRREDRRRMDAGDCECCRDYYEAVGPLPARLQAPLWRSPPTTPAKPCTRHQQHLSASTGDDTHQSEIASHRQAISRHRHHWERAKTPPGYRNIGFPDTQEAEDINERAREMHRRKKEEIEAAARREDGRYRRRS